METRIRTLIIIPISLDPRVVDGCITNYGHEGAVSIGRKTLAFNEIPRRLLKEVNAGLESGLGGQMVVFEAEKLLRPPVTSPKSYASPTVEDAEKYISWLFNPEELTSNSS